MTGPVGEAGTTPGRGRRWLLGGTTLVVVLVVAGVVGWGRWQQARQDAAVDACQDEVNAVLDQEAGELGRFSQVRGVERTENGYVVRIEGAVLVDGRPDPDRQRVRTCEATEQDGQWVGELAP